MDGGSPVDSLGALFQAKSATLKVASRMDAASALRAISRRAL
jgi:hypothetical protein